MNSRDPSPSTACRAAVATLALLAVLTACGGERDRTADDPAGPGGADETASTTPAVDRSELERLGRDLLADTGATGGIVALAAGDVAPEIVAFGTAAPTDDVPGEPVTVDDPLFVASITKSYVAALALVMAADGTVDLDEPISRWLDWPGGDRITLRQLLDHSSGLGAFGDGEEAPAHDELVARGEPVALRESLDAARSTAPWAAPGTATRYGNLNYVVAGGALEAAGGRPLDQLLRDRVFGPLGLDDTWYPPEQPDVPPPVGLHEVDPGLRPAPSSTLPLEAWRTVIGPASGAVATTADVLAWSEAVLGDRLLDGIDLAAMTEIGPGGVGLGVIGVTPTGDCVFDGCPPGAVFDRWALNGDFPGSSTRLFHDPGEDLTLFVYLNRDGLSLDAPMIEFLDDLS